MNAKNKMMAAALLKARPYAYAYSKPDKVNQARIAQWEETADVVALSLTAVQACRASAYREVMRAAGVSEASIAQFASVNF